MTIPAVYPAPQLIQGFAADDIFNLDQIEAAETVIGADGNMSSGFVFVVKTWGITLQADSPSMSIFDNWYEAEQLGRAKYPAVGGLTLPSIGTKWTMPICVLQRYKPTPDGARILRPRKFTLSLQSLNRSPI